MSDSDNPLGRKEQGKSKSSLEEMILEEIARQLSRQPGSIDQARPDGSEGNFSGHSTPLPLIIVGNVQNLSLNSSQPPAVLGTDVHHQPQHATYFSGARNVSITGGISRSIRHCEQGHGERNTAGGSAPRTTDRVGDGSITVIDGEVHNPTTHLQSLRYFDGAHHVTIAGGTVMNSHQPVTHAPGEEKTFPAPSMCDENPANQLETPAVVQQAANAPVVPSIHSTPASPEPVQDRTPPAKQPPLFATVTPSPNPLGWESRVAESSLRASSDVGIGTSGATIDSPSPSPRPSDSANHQVVGQEGKAKYRLRVAGRSWLFGRKTGNNKSCGEEEEQ
ncbi:hypothetical protein IWX90DRAFT_483561 [Phyllosticta citrichinensis]|uniref:Uncharacterized protein n=1 Tax=Phyllosticta citrichinensis TaxID=1130410 RepID=A0ABR1Y2Y9_9PEZI